MGDPRERNYQSLFSELAGYEKKGVYMLMNGVPASPMQIVQAHIVREDAVFIQEGSQCLDCTGSLLYNRYIRWEMTPTSIGGEKQAGISGGSQSPS